MSLKPYQLEQLLDAGAPLSGLLDGWFADTEPGHDRPGEHLPLHADQSCAPHLTRYAGAAPEQSQKPFSTCPTCAPSADLDAQLPGLGAFATHVASVPGALVAATRELTGPLSDAGLVLASEQLRFVRGVVDPALHPSPAGWHAEQLPHRLTTQMEQWALAWFESARVRCAELTARYVATGTFREVLAGTARQLRLTSAAGAADRYVLVAYPEQKLRRVDPRAAGEILLTATPHAWVAERPTPVALYRLPDLLAQLLLIGVPSAEDAGPVAPGDTSATVSTAAAMLSSAGSGPLGDPRAAFTAARNVLTDTAGTGRGFWF